MPFRTAASHISPMWSRFLKVLWWDGQTSTFWSLVCTYGDNRCIDVYCGNSATREYNFENLCVFAMCTCFALAHWEGQVNFYAGVSSCHHSCAVEGCLHTPSTAFSDGCLRCQAVPGLLTHPFSMTYNVGVTHSFLQCFPWKFTDSHHWRLL